MFHKVPGYVFDRLEAKACSKLSLERNSQRLGEPGRSEEVNRLAEVWRAGHVLELVSVVTSIEDIESFEEETELLMLAPVEELGNTDIQLAKDIPPHCIRRQLVLVIYAWVNGFPIISYAIAVDVANAGR